MSRAWRAALTLALGLIFWLATGTVLDVTWAIGGDSAPVSSVSSVSSKAVVPATVGNRFTYGLDMAHSTAQPAATSSLAGGGLRQYFQTAPGSLPSTTTTTTTISTSVTTLPSGQILPPRTAATTTTSVESGDGSSWRDRGEYATGVTGVIVGGLHGGWAYNRIWPGGFHIAILDNLARHHSHLRFVPGMASKAVGLGYVIGNAAFGGAVANWLWSSNVSTARAGGHIRGD